MSILYLKGYLLYPLMFLGLGGLAPVNSVVPLRTRFQNEPKMKK